ncbi:MAG: KTSC domain-containing protein [Hyphomonadaceae bacterium]
MIENVSSTAIDQIQYDHARAQLKITFKSGRTYVYEGVAPDTYENLMSADSQGGYFNRNIRDAYEFSEIR